MLVRFIGKDTEVWPDWAIFESFYLRIANYSCSNHRYILGYFEKHKFKRNNYYGYFGPLGKIWVTHKIQHLVIRSAVSGTGCATKEVTSNNLGTWFESSHRQILLELFIVAELRNNYEKTTMKKKKRGIVH